MPSVRALPATTGAGTASHVRVQDRLRSGGQALREHGEQALLLVHVGMPAHVPGHDLLARHVVHGRKIRLAARDLELGDIGPELGERTLGVEVAFEQVMHVATRLALYELYLLHGFAARIRHLSPMRRMTLSTLLADTRRPNSWTRHMRTCRWPHPLAVRPQISRTNGSRSARVTCAVCDRWW